MTEAAEITAIKTLGENIVRWTIRPRALDLAKVKLGDSIALNGACLTVVENCDGMLSFDLSPETLDKTSLGSLSAGERVHVESALRVGDSLGGHYVSGHVDGVAEVDSVEIQQDFWKVAVRLEGSVREAVGPFLVPKGSICVDGVSLTVNRVWDEPQKSFFEVMLIPHTLEKTNFSKLVRGFRLNLEADLLAKYTVRARDFILKGTS